MFKLNIQHSKNLKTSTFGYRNQPGIYKHQQGYHNVESPMKAAFRLQTSPRKSLSPIKLNTESKINLNRSRSPILLSKRQDQYLSNRKVSPFRKMESRQVQQNHFQQKNMSFTNLIRKNSSTTQYETHNPSLFTKTLEHSTSNYLQSDRNFRQDTNLFKKLASMLESNKSNKSFLNSGINDNSVKYKPMPQSCKNQSSPNTKIFIQNVVTVQSIQSSEERDYAEEANYYDEYRDIETKCYSEYEKMTAQHTTLQRKASNSSYHEKSEPRMEKKQSKRASNQVQEDEILSFKKIGFVNQKAQTEQQAPGNNAINFHLTNSFGTTVNLKNQIIGSQTAVQKPGINPFEQISQQISEPIPVPQAQFIPRELNESQDSVFASLQMLLSKVKQRQSGYQVNKENESINISIMSENQSFDMDMEPYLQKRN